MSLLVCLSHKGDTDVSQKLNWFHKKVFMCAFISSFTVTVNESVRIRSCSTQLPEQLPVINTSILLCHLTLFPIKTSGPVLHRPRCHPAHQHLSMWNNSRVINPSVNATGWWYSKERRKKKGRHAVVEVKHEKESNWERSERWNYVDFK